MDPSWLGDMRRLIGMSRNHLSWILDTSPQSLAKWEQGNTERITPDQVDVIENMRLDFIESSSWLDDQGLTWDDLIPLRLASMKLGVSSNTLHALLRKAKIEPMNFGLLGLWVTHEDLTSCRNV